jgi:hypothetical protein
MLKLKKSLALALSVALPLLVQAQNKAPNVIVDMEGVDQAQYNADLQACQGAGTQVQAQDAEREAMAGTAARGAAVGAAAQVQSVVIPAARAQRPVQVLVSWPPVPATPRTGARPKSRQKTNGTWWSRTACAGVVTTY